MINAPTLRTRFESFVKGLNGYEHIDTLLSRNTAPEQRKRADYLLRDREIIVEQKALLSDPVEKTQRAAERIMSERGIILYGSQPAKSIFSSQPDANSLNQRLIGKLTETIDHGIADADKQIRDTKSIFRIPDATGVVVFLNESAKLLAPDVVQSAICSTLRKKSRDGEREYTSTDAAIMISEAETKSSTFRRT